MKYLRFSLILRLMCGSIYNKDHQIKNVTFSKADRLYILDF